MQAVKQSFSHRVLKSARQHWGTISEVVSYPFLAFLLQSNSRTELDDSGKPRVQVGQSVLQKFAVARVLCSFELLKHPLAGQKQALLLALAGNLVGSQTRLFWVGG
jgi:hypothetical protein